MHGVRVFRAAKSIIAAAVDVSSTVVSKSLIPSSSVQGLAVCAEQTQTLVLLYSLDQLVHIRQKYPQS